MAQSMTDPSSFLRFSVTYSSIALLYYDYILTFPKEVKYIWGRKILRLSTLLYLGCRYALIANVLFLFSIDGGSGLKCVTGYQVSSALAVVGRTSIIAVWGMRTFAVFERNKYVMAFFLILGTICTVLEIIEVPFQSCTTGKMRIPVSTIVSIVTLVLYSASTILTTHRCYRALKMWEPPVGHRKSLHYLIMEQGLLYFGAVSILTTISLIVNFRVTTDNLANRLLSALTLPVSGLLTARLILHLREFADGTTVVDMEDGSTSSAIIWSEPADSVTKTLFSVKDFGEDPIQYLTRTQGFGGNLTNV